MNKLNVVLAAVAAPFLVIAGPTISDIRLSQNMSREVTITYKLAGEPAVVTMDIITNCVGGAESCPGASIGGRNLWYAQGDVNRLVGKGFDFSDGATKDCTITWTPNNTPIGESGFKADAESVRAVVKAWATNCPPDYMVVSLDVPATTYGGANAGARAEYYPAADFVPGGVTENPVYKETKVVMRKIPAAGIIWRMGSTAASDGSERTANEEIPRLVRLSYDYYMGVFPVTQGQYVCVTNENPSLWSATCATTNVPDWAWHPVEFGSTVNGVALSQLHNLRGPDDNPIAARPAEDSILGLMSAASGVQFDLPKEAEWEYACRAGSGSKYGRGEDGFDIKSYKELTWTGQNTKPSGIVGCMKPNAWGLYDMFGLVWDLCLDYYINGENLYATFEGKGYVDPVEDPFVDSTAGVGSWKDRKNRVLKGGSLSGGSLQFRAAFRSYGSFGWTTQLLGFRLRAPAVAE